MMVRVAVTGEGPARLTLASQDGASGKTGGSAKEDRFTRAEVRFLSGDRDDQLNATTQIRNLFANKDDTACETHDLLACDCGPSTVPETMDDEEAADSDDDLPSIDSAFVKASQYTSSAKEVRTLHDVGGN